MVSKSSMGPTTVKRPDEGSNDAPDPLNGIDKQLNDLNIDRGSPGRKKNPLPSSSLTIHPTPYVSIQSAILSASLLGSPNNERSYLLENMQRQRARAERLLHALASVEVRLASVQNKSEARKLQKESRVLKSKIAESRKQEQLIMLRLNDIQNEDLTRGALFQAQSAGSTPYPTPWSPMTLPVNMSPMHPVSPLTPLPPGIYHPSPIVPSPMTSPYWLGAQHYPILSPVVPNDPSLYYGANFQRPQMPEGAIAGPSRRESAVPPVTRPRGSKHKATKSVDFALPQEGACTGRRWSLADAFSPMPKDKRMSMPGLQTIWKKEEHEEE